MPKRLERLDAIIPGVRRRRTTICCSAIALVAICGCALAARQLRTVPLPFFPIRTVWTLALNSALSAPPAFSATHAYFSLEANRLATYDLHAGSLIWIVSARPQSQPAAGGGLVFVAEPDAISALR